MYCLRDVIFGLRNEYLENEKRLQALKKFLVVDRSKVKDFDVRTVLNEDVIRVIVAIEEKQSFIRRFLKEQDTSLEVRKGADNRYGIQPNKYLLQVIEAYQRVFDRKVREIKSSDTVYNIGLYRKAYLENSLSKSLEINPNFTSFTVMDDSTYTTCMYLPKEDSISLKTNRGVIDKDFCLEFLDEKISEEEIPLYNRIIIDKCEKKDVCVHMDGVKEKVKLLVREDDEGYYLRKKRK